MRSARNADDSSRRAAAPGGIGVCAPRRARIPWIDGDVFDGASVRSTRRSRVLRRRIAALAVAGLLVLGLVALFLADRGGPRGAGARLPKATSAKQPGSASPERPTAGGATKPPARVALPAHLPVVLPHREVVVPILMYHRIDRLTPALSALQRALTVAPSDFAAQMRWLRQNGYRTITQIELWNALMHGAALPSKPIMLTFDDGYRDVFGQAMPVLRRFKMRATAYVITDRINGPDPSFLTWGRIRSLERNGFEIGSHSVSHADLTALDAASARRQLVVSKRTLERHLGHPDPWFAYPYGKHNAAVVALARQAGYLLAMTTTPSARQHAATPLELDRYEVLDTTRVGGLARLLGG